MSAKPKLSSALKTSCLKLLEKAVGKTTDNPSELTPEKIRRILIIRRYDDFVYDEEQVIQISERILERYPKASRLNFEDFDISDKVLEKHLYTFDT